MRSTPATSWVALCAAWAALSLLTWLLPSDLLDWQPALIATQPWRSVTAAFVHWTPLHLAANLAGCAVLALLGHRAALAGRAALAAVLALPLTQLALLSRPDLLRYAGLSGALHALAAIAALALLRHTDRRDRLVGAGLAIGLVVKLALEDPFGPALRPTAGFDFPVAPFAHFSGCIAGLLCGALTMRGRTNDKESPHGT
jgi:rhomboid family GlyGly-CTERM serine protease